MTEEDVKYIKIMFEEIKDDVKTIKEGYTVLNNKIDRVENKLDNHIKDNKQQHDWLIERMDKGFSEAKADRKRIESEAKAERKRIESEAEKERKRIENMLDKGFSDLKQKVDKHEDLLV